MKTTNILLTVTMLTALYATFVLKSVETKLNVIESQITNIEVKITK